jgi:anthranilate/para-aminobenzoate synthase component I
VGGGITLESDPAEEWNETRLKAQSLLKIMGAYMEIPE